MNCKICGNTIRPEQHFCQACGANLQTASNTEKLKKHHGRNSMIFGTLALTMHVVQELNIFYETLIPYCIAIILSLLGFTFGIMGLKTSERKLAIVGTAFSSIAIVIALVIFILGIIAGVFFFINGFTDIFITGF